MKSETFIAWSDLYVSILTPRYKGKIGNSRLKILTDRQLI
jgi:hypothetical protein